MATTKKAGGLTIEKFIRYFKTCTGWKCEAGMRISVHSFVLRVDGRNIIKAVTRRQQVRGGGVVRNLRLLPRRTSLHA